MADPGNGYAPTTLEQLAHAFVEERDATRARFGDFEGRWGKQLTETIELQRSQRAVVRDLRMLIGRFNSYLLDEDTRRKAAGELERQRFEQLQAQIRAAFAVARERKAKD